MKKRLLSIILIFTLILIQALSIPVLADESDPTPQGDQVQMWVGNTKVIGPNSSAQGGKVAVKYTPSYNVYEDIVARDGTNFVAGDILQFYKGDECTVYQQADDGYRFVGWYHVNIEWAPGEDLAWEGDVISTDSSFTYKPGETVIPGDSEPLRYVCAVFEQNSSKPKRTVITEFIARPYATEVVPYDTDLAEYTSGKKWNASTTDTEMNNRWLELFGEVNGVWQYPAQTGLTYSFIDQEETDTEIINKYSITYDQVIVTKAAQPIEPSEDEPETDVVPSSDDSKDVTPTDNTPSEAVKTGDTAHPWIFVGLALASPLCVAIMILVYKRKRTNN